MKSKSMDCQEYLKSGRNVLAMLSNLIFLHNFLTPREIFYYSAKLKCIEGEGMIEERIETMLLSTGTYLNSIKTNFPVESVAAKRNE